MATIDVLTLPTKVVAVVEMLRKGASVKSIASDLDCSLSQISKIVFPIREYLGVLPGQWIVHCREDRLVQLSKSINALGWIMQCSPVERHTLKTWQASEYDFYKTAKLLHYSPSAISKHLKSREKFCWTKSQLIEELELKRKSLQGSKLYSP